MSVKFIGLPTSAVAALREGAEDSNGQAPEVAVSSGVGVPCRHCMRPVEKGERYLVLGHRPFETIQPYAEVGPLYVHADACDRADLVDELPEMLESETYILRGYDAGERIVYGTGDVVPNGEIITRAEEILAEPEVVFVHIRSAQNNCFQCRVELLNS